MLLLNGQFRARTQAAYWKKLTLLLAFDVVEMSCAQRKILRRCQTGEFLKIMNEVSLIIVPYGESEIDPIDYRLLLNGADHLLKAKDPAEELWRQPNLFPKDFNKPSLAETHAVGVAVQME